MSEGSAAKSSHLFDTISKLGTISELRLSAEGPVEFKVTVPADRLGDQEVRSALAAITDRMM